MENERPPSAVMPPNRRIFWWIKRRRVNGYGSQHVVPFLGSTCFPHVPLFTAVPRRGRLYSPRGIL
jgi:hypothetical protein